MMLCVYEHMHTLSPAYVFSPGGALEQWDESSGAWIPVRRPSEYNFVRCIFSHKSLEFDQDSCGLDWREDGVILG